MTLIFLWSQIHKVEKISETFNIEFCLEVFNFANRTNSNPVASNEVLFDVSTVDQKM